MSGQEIINLVVAIIVAAPASILIVQALKRVGWPVAVKTILSVAVCIAVGLAQTWITGDLLGLLSDWGDLTSAQVIAWALAVYAAAQVEYRVYFAGLPWMGRLAEWTGLRK